MKSNKLQGKVPENLPRLMYSLFGACKVLSKNPERRLVYVLYHIKTMPKDKLVNHQYSVR
nr:hypothetical protein [Prevotella sp.]